VSRVVFGRRLTARWDAKLDATAVAAGEKLHVQDPLTDLCPVTHQRRPSAADPADPKVLDPK
jgi:hypothetical protein